MPADVLDLTARLPKRSAAPAVGLAVSAFNERGHEDGDVYLLLTDENGVRRIPLTPESAQTLAANLRTLGHVADRRARHLIALRRVNNAGVVTTEDVELHAVVEHRGSAVLLESVRSGKRAWYSTLTGDPVYPERRRAALRVCARDALFLRTNQEDQLCPNKNPRK